MGKKILVIGCPGSGKSYFSKQLNKITSIPLYHLDNLFWNEDKTNVTHEVFLSRVNSILKKDEWIIDGNYHVTLKERLKEADTVFFLDYPLDVCVKGITQRIGIKRDDLPWIEEKVDDDFLVTVLTFSNEIKPVMLGLIKKYKSGEKIYVFHSRQEGDEYIEDLKKHFTSNDQSV